MKDDQTPSQMSHQTGAQLTVLPSQTTELMKYIKQPNPAHIMNMHVPTFHAARNSRQTGGDRSGKGKTNLPNASTEV